MAPTRLRRRGVAVDLELVLAVDASRSIDADEAALQRAGYIAAITHPDFIRAIKTGANARIALSYFDGPGRSGRIPSCPGK